MLYSLPCPKQFINTVSGSHMRISSGLRSCTNVVQIAPPFVLDGRSVTLIDTPGFDDTTKSDTEILRMIALFLTETYQHGKKLAGVIYIHRISDFRMGGISTRNFKMFRQLCGDSTLKNIIILTNMWGHVGNDVGEARERELASDELFFKSVLEKGAQMLRHDHTLESAQAIIKRLLDNKPLALQIQREIVDEDKDILQTAAGTELNKELLAEKARHKKDMIDLQQELEAAMNEKDEETRRELEAEARKLQKEMDRIDAESRNLADNFQKEKADLQKRLNEMDAEAKEKQQQMQEEYDKKMEEIEKQRRMDADQSREKQEDYGRQIAELQRSGRGGFWTSIGRAIDGLFGVH
ncbi:hypothetical protein EST38_g3035 [Candolleomyces aberdarensis]|uniref:G domain-containing protein n=1 Tax=Candolleomyces aberdarensis TaxID=2316362 RepID=A0A4Q2DS35_9AGAR|nr:hypothetical protein EST38_g3035 [Candolleomyces aberdarensis]